MDARLIYWSINGKECEIIIEARPSYCDRGNWIAKIFPIGKLEQEIDHQDDWPRYYFSAHVAFNEVMEWLKKRKQFVEENKWEEHEIK